MFDNSCKFLVENFSRDFATWLLGEPVTLTELSPTELSLEPIRADALILRQSEEMVLHIEFQTDPDDDIPFRMTDYRLRGYRRFPKKRMRQIVVYLRKTKSDKVNQTTFTLENTVHEFELIRLWEQPTEIFLQFPGLLPLAVLSNTDDKANTLQQVATAINKITDKKIQSTLTASAFILAGLVLEKEVIQRLLRRDIMRESVTYQALVEEIREELIPEIREQSRQKIREELIPEIREEIRAEIRAEIREGLIPEIREEIRAEIRAEIPEETVRHIVVSMLKDGLSIEIVAKFTGLTVEQIQQLQITAATIKKEQETGEEV